MNTNSMNPQGGGSNNMGPNNGQGMNSGGNSWSMPTNQGMNPNGQNSLDNIMQMFKGLRGGKKL